MRSVNIKNQGALSMELGAGRIAYQLAPRSKSYAPRALLDADKFDSVEIIYPLSNCRTCLSKSVVSPCQKSASDRLPLYLTVIDALNEVVD